MSRLITFVTLCAFALSWFAPLANSAIKGHTDSSPNSSKESHYCELSAGPCKHGLACPLKELHSKVEENHNAHKKTADGIYTSKECHGSSGAALNTAFAPDTILLLSKSPALHIEESTEPLIPDRTAQYKDRFPATQYKPPEVI